VSIVGDSGSERFDLQCSSAWVAEAQPPSTRNRDGLVGAFPRGKATT
jgi:hypothetical protein